MLDNGKKNVFEVILKIIKKFFKLDTARASQHNMYIR